MDEAEDQFLPEIVSKAIKLPGVKVDRRAFLAKTFNHLKSADLAQLVDQSPQSLYEAKDLIKVANRVGFKRHGEKYGLFFCCRAAV